MKLSIKLSLFKLGMFHDNKYFRYLLFTILLLLLLMRVNIVVAATVLPPLNETNSEQQLNGKFTWFDLASVDIEKHKLFYGDVFGWTFKTISASDDQYTLIMNNGHNIAGLFNIKTSGNTKLGGIWIGLMSVADPIAAAKIVKASGGSVHTPPTTLAKRGTFAVFIDPEGAMFGVLKSNSGDPADEEIKIGEFLWMDLFAKNQSRSGKFYQQIAGYKIEERAVTKDIKRQVLLSSNKPRAGIVPLPETANRSGWLPYIKVDDINATLKKVEASGGYVMVAPTKELYEGNLAIFTDPLGGVMGIVKWVKPITVKK
jgi:predicted enzyme related to lactoylglutathione lyase